MSLLRTSSDLRTPLVEAAVRWLGRNQTHLVKPYLAFGDFNEDLVHYWHIVSEAFRQNPAGPPNIDPPELRILNVACGYGEDTIAISALFNQYAFGFLPRPVDYTGIDLRENALVRARRNAHSTRTFFQRGLKDEHVPFRFRFPNTDATKLDQLPLFADPFDLIISRHQNCYQGLDLWSKIFAQALGRLKPTGLLLMTSYYDKEHHIALEAMRALGARLLISLTNPNSRQMTHEGQTLDRHVALFAPPSPDEPGGLITAVQPAGLLLPGSLDSIDFSF